jgi:glycosyltransferase involved in cell wall biosynthesis
LIRADKIKVLYLDEIGRIDGAEVVLYNLVTNLDKGRFIPTVVCGSDGKLVDKLRAQNIRVYILKMKETNKLTFNIGRFKLFNPLSAVVNFSNGIIFGIKFYLFLKKHDADIVHTNSLLSNLYGAIPARFAGKRLIWHEHNIQPPGIRRYIINVMAKLFPDRIITITSAVRSIYSAIPDGPKICTIYNGIDVNKFITAKRGCSLRSEFMIPADIQLVAITAVLRPWKGHKYFLLAAKEILKNLRKIKFVIIGDEVFNKDSGYRKYLENLALTLGIEKDVIFTGFRTDIPEILSEIDILVSASVLPEPFSLIILEAMASSKPVVATNTGGVPEVVKNEVTGLLVEPEDYKQMAKAILWLLQNKDAAIKMGRLARIRAAKHFSLTSFVRSVEGVYFNVLK